MKFHIRRYPMSRFFVLILFVAISVAGCQQKDNSSPQFQPPVGSGPIQGFDKVKALQDVVAKDPNNMNAWIQLGNIMMDTKRYTEAVEAYQKALAMDPTNTDVRVDMGTCMRESGRPEMGIAEYKKALEYNPNHINANRNLVVVLMYDLRDGKQAMKYFEKYLSLVPNAPDAAALRADLDKLTGSAQ